MVQCWDTRVELVSSLKEDTTSSLLTIHVVKMDQTEGIFVVDVEGLSLVNLNKRLLLSYS